MTRMRTKKNFLCELNKLQKFSQVAIILDFRETPTQHDLYIEQTLQEKKVSDWVSQRPATIIANSTFSGPLRVSSVNRKSMITTRCDYPNETVSLDFRHAP